MTENELQTASKFGDLKSSQEINSDIYAETQCDHMCLLVVRPVFHFLLNGNVRLYFYVNCLFKECFTHKLLSLVAHAAQLDQ